MPFLPCLMLSARGYKGLGLKQGDMKQVYDFYIINLNIKKYKFKGVS
jgi:hypothetical protein